MSEDRNGTRMRIQPVVVIASPESGAVAPAYHSTCYRESEAKPRAFTLSAGLAAMGIDAGEIERHCRRCGAGLLAELSG